MSDESPKGRLSSRVEPFWLNPATIKGTIAITGGVLVLMAPDLSALLLRTTLGVILVATGLSDIWFGLRREASGHLRSIVEGALTLAFGVAILVLPSETIRALALFVVAYLAVRGLGILGSAFTLARGGAAWKLQVVRGLLYIAVAILVFLVPRPFIETLVGAVAAAAVIVGAIMLAYGIRERSDDELVDVDVASVTEMVSDWLRERDIEQQRRDRIGDGFFFEGTERTEKLASWWVMLLLSVAIATFGIMQDSTAVVIGAMLIAPLMVPILGIGAGIVNAWTERVWASFSLVLAGAAAAIALSFVLGQWAPIIVPLAENTQVTSRVSPNLVDMLIALAAGAAGAYANVNDRVSDSIAGVAIAVALVPPLGVVGLTLQAGMFDESMGALLLFLTNLVSIVLAATVVFFLTGYAPYRRLQEDRDTITALLRTVSLAAIAILIPLVLAAESVLTDISRQREATQSVQDWLDGVSLSPVRVDVEGDVVGVFLTGPDEVPPVEDLQATLEDAFDAPVEVRVEHAVTMVITSG